MNGVIRHAFLKEYTLEVENVSISFLTMEKNATKGNPDASLRDLFHTHTFTELFVCRRGSLTVDTECGSFSLNSGDVAVIPSDYRHTMRYQNFELSQTEMTSLGLMAVRQKKAVSNDLYTPFYELLFAHGIAVCRNCPDLVEELCLLDTFQKNEVPFKVLLRLLTALLTLTEKKWETVGTRAQLKQKRTAENSIDMTRVALIEEMINAHYLEDLTADALANMVYISRRQLDRIIVARYGRPLRAVINEKRIRYAERLMKDTDRTFEEIRTAACFPSIASFNRVFQDAYGVTPSEYRRQLTDT